MTDTARTLAAIKALLADNTTRDISPQDMRDTVESIANPLRGGGLDRALGSGVDEIASFYTKTINFNTTSGVYYELEAAHSAQDVIDGWLYDPAGWLQSGALAAEDDWYDTGLPAYTWIMLPPGFYMATAGAFWASDFGSSGESWNLALNIRDIRMDTPGFDPWAGTPNYAAGMWDNAVKTAAAMPIFNAGKFWHESMAFTRVPESAGAVPFSVWSIRQTTGSDKTWGSGYVNIARIGDGG